MKNLFFFILLAPSALLAGETWVLESSTLTYHVTHKLHKSQGTSVASRGKGVCGPQGCDFLVASPVNSFVSGDHNRDLHMLETVRGAAHPLVKVSVHLDKAPSQDFAADLDIEFAGLKHHYPQVPFHVEERGADVIRFTSKLPLTLKDFDIPPPSLLTIPIKNEIPLDVAMAWRSK